MRDSTLAPFSIPDPNPNQYPTPNPNPIPVPNPYPHKGCSTTTTSSQRASVARSVARSSSSSPCCTRRGRTGTAGSTLSTSNPSTTPGPLALTSRVCLTLTLTSHLSPLALTLTPTLTRFEAVPGTPNHNVNVAQGLKSAAVLARFNASATHANRSMASLSLRRMRKLDAAYGLPTGMYVGDEITPLPYTRSPSRGVELCGVVEAMYSYEVCAQPVALASWRLPVRHGPTQPPTSTTCTPSCLRRSCTRRTASWPSLTAPRGSHTTRCPPPGPHPPGATCGHTSTCRQRLQASSTNPAPNPNPNPSLNLNPHPQPSP